MARRLTRALAWAAALALLAAVPSIARAGSADLIAVTAQRRASGVYDRDVTSRGQDTGWERYADRIEVLDADGKVLATRILVHPHEDEQPFTRDVPDIRIPAGTQKMRVRAHVNPVGYDGAVLEVTLPRR